MQTQDMLTTAAISGSEIELIVSLVLAAVLGAFLGVERSLAGKHAGMRTYALVSLGSCLFVLLGTVASGSLAQYFPGVNPLQIAGSIVIGIGFIGSGLAIMRGEHAELTTATGIWVVAGVGMACGFGLYLLAVVATVIAATVLSLFLRLENVLRKKAGSSTDQ
jgi:putative Mg2+ transporter-C (MgtC) family protein